MEFDADSDRDAARALILGCDWRRSHGLASPRVHGTNEACLQVCAERDCTSGRRVRRGCAMDGPASPATTRPSPDGPRRAWPDPEDPDRHGRGCGPQLRVLGTPRPPRGPRRDRRGAARRLGPAARASRAPSGRACTKRSERRSSSARRIAARLCQRGRLGAGQSAASSPALCEPLPEAGATAGRTRTCCRARGSLPRTRGPRSAPATRPSTPIAASIPPSSQARPSPSRTRPPPGPVMQRRPSCTGAGAGSTAGPA